MTVSPVDEIIDGSINEIDGVESLASFNKAALLASIADTPEDSFGEGYVKEYALNSTGQAAALADWGASSNTYKAYLKMKAQEKKPNYVQIIKRGALVAEEQEITFSQAIQSDETIVGVVNGVAVSVAYSVDSPTTLGLLVTALEAIEGIDDCTLDTLTIEVVSDTEWNIPISLACEGNEDPTLVTVETSNTPHTAQTDIDNALTDDTFNDWYLLVATTENKGQNLALAHHAEVIKREFWGRTNESTVKTSGNTTNTGSRLQALGYKYTTMFWHHDMTEFINAAAAAYCLGVSPGKFQLAHKQLIGVTATPLTSMSAAEVAIAQGRNVNTYRKIGTKGLIQPGVRVDGKPAEMTRDLNFALNKNIERIYAWMTAPDKVDYDDTGRSQLEAILSEVNRYLASPEVGIARRDLPATSSVTSFESMDPADVSAGYFVSQSTFYYKRGAQKVTFVLNSVFGGAA